MSAAEGLKKGAPASSKQVSGGGPERAQEPRGVTELIAEVRLWVGNILTFAQS